MKPAIFNQKNRKDVFNMKRLYSNIPPIMTRKDLQDILQISKNTALELFTNIFAKNFSSLNPTIDAASIAK